MVQTIAISEKTNLHDLRKFFGLTLNEEEQFFREWTDDLPQLTDAEKQALDRVKRNFLDLIDRTAASENLVKLSVLSFLLDLAGFYSPDFQIKDEASVNINVEDEDITYTGKIDILVVQEQFWIIVIESKNSRLSLNNGIPQALAYMLASPHPTTPTFGMVLNGSEFIFLKLLRQSVPQYAYSRVFSLLNPGNDLYNVLSSLKKLKQLALPSSGEQ